MTRIPNQAVYYDYGAHAISEAQLDRNALKILNQLNQAGFEAYLVGGCIRDLLLGQNPKDFDIATNARPEEVANLFRNCRLIGRRFRLAHIHFGRDIIEVATFRGAPERERRTDAAGQVLEDNHYGTMAEDAARRDFTINALYYDARNAMIIDHIGAMQDIENRVIRIIGDPATRYAEDPVRMLRAARLSAKLDLPLDPDTAAAIAPMREHLRGIPAARLFDETQKIFMSGHGVKSFDALQRHGLLGELFPDVARVLAHPNRAFAQYAENIIRIALANTDARVAEGKPVTIAFLFAAFLWPVYQLQYQGLLKERDNWHSAMHEAVDTVHIAAAERVSIPVRLRGMIREIWTLQARFELAGNSARKIRALLSHPRFRAAYDFLLIREAAGEPLADMAQWWTRIQEESDITPRSSHDNPRPRNTMRRRRSRNRAR
ncbi:MAG: polynucleotide adenylyltransferase PcnB [Cardiobacteriaceae bacterium]|nr:polynucleotide adenylyltransferase PcnB [Cardiobacteriaceae bacterium]